MLRNPSRKIPIALISIVVGVYFSHYFIYYSIVHFFGLPGGGRRVALALLLLLLPAGFIAASILAYWESNGFSRVFYFGTALWLGVGSTLVVTFALAWGARGAILLFTHSPTPALFGGAAVLLACLYSGYGIWNAYHPRTEAITVRIKNLPPAWRGKKMVHLSDIHLGHILGAGFLKSLVEKVNAQDPSMVVITGDLFDGADGKLNELVAPLNEIRAPEGIYFVTGNHETYLGTERAYAALRTTKARVLRDEMVMVNGLAIAGVSYPERGEAKDVVGVIRQMPGFDPTVPTILLYHTPSQAEKIMATGVSLQLSGHTHKGQIFPIQFISRMVYGKYYNGLHTEGDYTLYTSSGAGAWGPTMRTGNHPEITVIHLE